MPLRGLPLRSAKRALDGRTDVTRWGRVDHDMRAVEPVAVAVAVERVAEELSRLAHTPCHRRGERAARILVRPHGLEQVVAGAGAVADIASERLSD